MHSSHRFASPSRLHALASLLAWLLLAVPLSGAGIRLDFGRTNGVIRPLHGVNLGPLCYRGLVDLSSYHRELAVPVTRLHDVVWLNAEAVDIHTVFPDFRNDPNQPASYFFAATDDYLQAVVNVGSQIVYRLGESIEHTRRQYHVHPPSDPQKWAQICLGIVRHYNEGWADGFRHGIRYWEIWNEPDVRPQMWTGTDEQFLDLFTVAAKAIKARFPDAKVGGPAVGSVGEFDGDTFRPAPFVARFLDHCRSNQVPLDFFSWHRYTADPWDLPRRAAAVRRLLDEQGFSSAESHLNEWNYLPGNDWSPMGPGGMGRRREQWYAELSGPRGAAFAAAVLTLLQDSPVDVAAYYTGEIQGFGLFDLHGVPRKTYQAFKAFRRLLDTPVRVNTAATQLTGMTLLAGVGRDRRAGTLLLANVNSSESQVTVTPSGLPWAGGTRYVVQRLDAEHDLDPVAAGTLALGEPLEITDFKAPAVVLVRLEPVP